MASDSSEPSIPSAVELLMADGCFIGPHLTTMLKTYLGQDIENLSDKLSISPEDSEFYVKQVLPVIRKCTYEDDTLFTLETLRSKFPTRRFPDYRAFVSALTASGAPMYTRGFFELAKRLNDKPWPPWKIRKDLQTAKKMSDILAVCQYAQRKINEEAGSSRSPEEQASPEVDEASVPECDEYIQTGMRNAMKEGVGSLNRFKETTMYHCIKTTIRNTLESIWDTYFSAKYPSATQNELKKEDITYLEKTCTEQIVPYLIGVLEQCASLNSGAEYDRSLPGRSNSQPDVTRVQRSFGEALTSELESALRSGEDRSNRLKMQIMRHHLVAGLCDHFSKGNDFVEVSVCDCRNCNEGPLKPSE